MNNQEITCYLNGIVHKIKLLKNEIIFHLKLNYNKINSK